MKRNVILILLFSQTGLAAPILNKGMPTRSQLLIYPDHRDPNLYYFSPTSLILAKDESGRQIFSYSEYSCGREKRGSHQRCATLQFMMELAFDQKRMESAMTSILAQNSKAGFSPLPFINSKIRVSSNSQRYISRGSCSHAAGVVGQLQECTVFLNPLGRKVIRNSLESGGLLAVQFQYEVRGVVEGGDGLFEDQVTYSGVGGYLNGREISLN